MYLAYCIFIFWITNYTYIDNGWHSLSSHYVLFSALIAFNPWKVFMKKEFVPFNNYRTIIWTNLPLSDSKVHDDIAGVMPVCPSTSLYVAQDGPNFLICLIAGRIEHGLHRVWEKLQVKVSLELIHILYVSGF